MAVDRTGYCNQLFWLQYTAGLPAVFVFRIAVLRIFRTALPDFRAKLGTCWPGRLLAGFLCLVWQLLISRTTGRSIGRSSWWANRALFGPPVLLAYWAVLATLSFAAPTVSASGAAVWLPFWTNQLSYRLAV